MAIFFAAGNDGTCCSAPNSVGAPGNAKSIISVGASQRGAIGDNMASFSSRGPVHDDRTKPDIVAQGQGILSVGSDGDATTGSCNTCELSGTSMASPTAAGLGALIREYLERGFYPSGDESPADSLPDPSGSLVKALLINGAHSMSGTGAGGGAPNQDQGWGRVNLENVLYFEGDDRQLWLIDETTGLETGQTHSYELMVNAGEPLDITLVWTDFPATIGAAVALVNELRLEVEDPSGDVWTQKLPASGAPNPFTDTSTEGFDDRNNVHQVRLEAPEGGTYQIRVVALNVAMGGSQHYALAANGDFVIEESSPGELALDPDALDFGEIEVGTDATLDILVSNIATAGSDNLVLSRFGLDGDAEFQVSGGDCEIDAVLEPQQSCTVEVTFSPLSVDSFANNLEIETADKQSQTVSLTGSGFRLPGELAVNLDALEFGEVQVGLETTLSVLISNAASAESDNLVLTLIELAGDVEFAISGGDCEIDGVLEPQQSCTVEVTFSPLSVDSFANDLEIETADDQSETVTLIGSSFQLPPEIFEDRFEDHDLN